MNIRNSSKRPIVFDVIIDGDVLPVRLGPGASFDPLRYLAALEVVREAGQIDTSACEAAGRHLYNSQDHGADYCRPDLAAAARDDAGPSREVAGPASVSVPADPGESGATSD